MCRFSNYLLEPMKDILNLFTSYSKEHPLRIMLSKGFDDDFNPLLPDGVWAVNTMQALIRALTIVRSYSQEAFDSLVHDKLAARKGKDGFDAHNFISALCELSVMCTFISASNRRESFKYEPRLISGKSKNVEFSIEIRGRLFEVEVKSANMIKQNEVFAKAMSASGTVIEPNARIMSLDSWKEVAGDTPLLGSLDNKIADFLNNAQVKFPPVTDSIHLLIICWDNSYRKALTALKSNISGLLTPNTYKPDLLYDHISHIIVTNQYGLIVDWLEGRLSMWHAMDPLNLRFAENYLIDYNLDKPADIYDYLIGILSCGELPVVNEDYVRQNCDEVLFTVDS